MRAGEERSQNAVGYTVCAMGMNGGGRQRKKGQWKEGGVSTHGRGKRIAGKEGEEAGAVVQKSSGRKGAGGKGQCVGSVLGGGCRTKWESMCGVHEPQEGQQARQEGACPSCLSRFYLCFVLLPIHISFFLSFYCIY